MSVFTAAALAVAVIAAVALYALLAAVGDLLDKAFDDKED